MGSDWKFEEWLREKGWIRDLKGYKLVVWMPNEPKYAVYGPPMSCYWEVYGVPVKRVRIRR